MIFRLIGISFGCSFRKLERELAAIERKLDARVRAEERKKWRRFARSQRKASW